MKKSINRLFRANVQDIMTGYRVYNRLFVKNFPVMSKGFEIETEMTIHALHRGFVIKELPIEYRDRPEGSESKLNTLSDGFKVIKTIVTIYKDYKPMAFFGTLSLLACLLGILCGIPAILDYIRERYVYHVPLSILAAAFEMLALNLLTSGLILYTVVKNDKKNYELRLIQYRNAI